MLSNSLPGRFVITGDTLTIKNLPYSRTLLQTRKISFIFSR